VLGAGDGDGQGVDGAYDQDRRGSVLEPVEVLGQPPKYHVARIRRQRFADHVSRVYQRVKHNDARATSQGESLGDLGAGPHHHSGAGDRSTARHSPTAACAPLAQERCSVCLLRQLALLPETIPNHRIGPRGGRLGVSRTTS
jgi:hypothetical protein